MQLFAFLLAASLAAVGVTAAPPKPGYHTVPPLRQQAIIQNAWTAERKTIIPGLLHKHGVDAWLLSQREYAEDTVFWSLKSAEQFSARRRTTILYLAGNASESSHAPETTARTKVLLDKLTGLTATEYYWIDNTPALWPELVSVLEAAEASSHKTSPEKASPLKIAINADKELAFSSGLHAGERDAIASGLGPHWAARLVSDVPLLPIEFVATMVPGRIGWFRRLMETSWALISEAFSEAVIVPGHTTTTDVEWWMRDRLQALNVTTWFHPSVTVLGAEDPFVEETSLGPKRLHTYTDSSSSYTPIQYGDLLHVDFGITALGLNTDTQHLAYVVPPGQTPADVPQGLVEGLRAGNRLQDLVRSTMSSSIGRSGDDILRDVRAAMDKENLKGRIYSHPVGDWGHAAGAVIGMTNLQDGVPVLGELPLLRNMYYSIELFAEHFVPERNTTIIFPLEEDVYWDADTQAFEWVYGRQEEFHFILPKEDAAVGTLQTNTEEL